MRDRLPARTVMAMTLPGWYDNPESPDSLRYWDGAAWTDQTRERLERTLVPPPPPTGATELVSASYLRRIGAVVIDSALCLPGAFVAVIGAFIYVLSDKSAAWALGVLVFGFAASIGAWIWNNVLRQGRTGQSVGKHVLRISLVDETSGAPIGVRRAMWRSLLPNLVGFVPFAGGIVQLIDVLYPLWDPRGQRLVDKLVHSRVVAAER